MAPQNRVFKTQPLKDGRNAKQRRKDKERAAGLSSDRHLAQVAKTLKNKILHQSNRWLDYNLRASDCRGLQDEYRWGFRWDTPLCERIERERAEARRAAGVGPEDWVDDWWGPTLTENNPITSDSTRVGTKVEGEGGDTLEQETERENENNDEETPDDDDDDDEGGTSENMSGVQRGVSRMEL